MEGAQQKQNVEGVRLPIELSLKTKLLLALMPKEDVLL